MPLYLPVRKHLLGKGVSGILPPPVDTAHAGRATANCHHVLIRVRKLPSLG